MIRYTSKSFLYERRYLEEIYKGTLRAEFPKKLKGSYKFDNEKSVDVIKKIWVDLAHISNRIEGKSYSTDDIYSMALYNGDTGTAEIVVAFPELKFHKNYLSLKKKKEYKGYLTGVDPFEIVKSKKDKNTEDKTDDKNLDDNTKTKLARYTKYQELLDIKDDLEKYLSKEGDPWRFSKLIDSFLIQVGIKKDKDKKDASKDQPDEQTKLAKQTASIDKELTAARLSDEVKTQIISLLKIAQSAVSKMSTDQEKSDYAGARPKAKNTQPATWWLPSTFEYIEKQIDSLKTNLKAKGVDVEENKSAKSNANNDAILTISINIYGKSANNFGNSMYKDINFTSLDSEDKQKLEDYLDKVAPKSAYEMHKKDDENLSAAIDMFEIDNLDNKTYKFKLIPTEAKEIGWFGNETLTSKLSLGDRLKRSKFIRKAAFVLTPSQVYDKWFVNGKIFMTLGTESEFHTYGAYLTDKPDEVIKTIAEITGEDLQFKPDIIKQKQLTK